MKCNEPACDSEEGQAAVLNGQKCKGAMAWVGRGRHTDKYTLRAGMGEPADDETHYVPGTKMTLYLSVAGGRAYKYKGLFVAAFAVITIPLVHFVTARSLRVPNE